MYCKNCGNLFADDADFCPNCGTLTNAEPQLAYSADQYDHARQPGAALGDYNGYPMKWYKFLIYFSLFAGAVLNLINGITMIFGVQYGMFEQDAYLIFPALRPIDIVYGCISIAVAGFGVYVRFELAKLKKGAPKKLMLLYIASVVASVLYLIACYLVLSSASNDKDLLLYLASDAISPIFAAVFLIFVNKYYFDKRESLFVN